MMLNDKINTRVLVPFAAILLKHDPMTDKQNSSNNENQPNGLSYADAGVDIDAGNALVEAIKPAVRSTRRPGADGEIGGFGGLFDLKSAGFSDPVLVAANDGVGTKLRVAIEANLHDTVGIDLVAMCVNDLIVQGAEPLFFLDYLATGALNVPEATSIVQGIAKGCKQAGCALIGGETAEMPGMYHNKDYDLAGFAVGAAERNQLLPTKDIEPGDVLVALASSGVHSNGFSLVRKLVEISGVSYDQPAPFAPDQTLGAALLTPTRIYVKPILNALKAAHKIKALVHITGGGFTENIPRILPENICANVNLSTIPVPPVFPWLAKTGSIATKEMLRTFNCGVGMIAIINGDDASMLVDFLNTEGENAFPIGTLVKRQNAQVQFHGNLNL